MIGFDEQPRTERGHHNEGPETKNLDKRDLYLMLQHRNYLPPMTSKGVTRDYLLKVHKLQVFTVPLIELKQFEVALTNQHTKRVGLANNALLIRKINALLKSRGLKELGFDDFDSPDEVGSSHQTWLFRVARFIDQGNVLEFFEAPVRAEDYAKAMKTAIGRVHFGRLKASKYFFRLAQAKRDRTLWDNLHTISSQYRAYLGQRVLLDKLERDVQAAKLKTAELGNQMDDLIGRASLTYTKMENPDFRQDLYLSNPSSLPKEHGAMVLLNSKL